MALRDGYCQPEDLMILGTKLPANAAEETIAAASDKMDAFIGAVYETPVLINESDPVKRQDSLVLKAICSQLASGILLTSAASAGEQSRTHAYGEYLLRFAYSQLQKIQNGSIKLTSAKELPVDQEDLTKRGPRIIQGQAYSLVDAYYENFEPEGFAPGRNASSGNWPQQNPQGVVW